MSIKYRFLTITKRGITKTKLKTSQNNIEEIGVNILTGYTCVGLVKATRRRSPNLN